MAEYVFQNVEGMLPELEEMERLELFTKPEIKSIVKKRTALEYKLRRRISQKTDYLRYIQYELNLDLLRRKRRKHRGIEQRVLPGEAVFIKRMHLLFQSALKKFPLDVKLWLQYIEYCKKAGSTQALGRVIGRMLQAHPHNANLWIMAAKWEFENQNNINSARSLMQRALRLNPESCHLWLEYFRLELLFMEKVKKRRQLLGVQDQKDKDVVDTPSSSEFLSGKTAHIVYKNAIQSISDNLEFRLKFVDIYDLFCDCDEGIDEVYRSLSKDFPLSEEAWNALAMRNLKEKQAGKLQDKDFDSLQSERNSVFEDAVQKVNTEKMWSYYLDACVGDLERHTISDKVLKKNVEHTLKVFRSAHEAKKLSAEKHVLWVKILQRNAKWNESLAICKNALKDFPSSVIIWKKYFTLQINENSCGNLIEELCGCLSHFKSDVDILDMWHFGVELFTSLQATDEIDRLYKSCVEICTSKNALEKISELYLELIFLRDGIKRARKLYKRLLKEIPMSFSLYQKCMTIEKSQAMPNMKRLRKLFETAVDNFGSDYSDIWIDYIRFEQKEGEPSLVANLHWRAMKSLSGEKVEQFITKYTLLQKDSS
ncbi:U3 small nucleolar RNA-associated protein 6 homolog [Xenia sp. Carnegie-2017]|uniref:U3 small nucleolar RNA-associated protein 6 homolog n=1 Tax=Xenia sp. Carnegie-2017 TaxID=2897299 RepID=UPI001F03A522|nr:U3 small nucleolar RNA-associated protein 6 homolog [Xenia sp. Carnegie-2017]